MKVYFLYLKLQLLKYFEYRANILIDICRTFLGVIVILFIWNTVYTSHHALPGYSFPSLIIYYLLAAGLSKLISTNACTNIALYIYKGTLSNLQLKPVSIPILLFIEVFAGDLTTIGIDAIVVSLIILLSPLKNAFSTTFLDSILFILSLIFAIMINYFIYSIIGNCAFWTTNIGGIKNMARNLINIFTGTLVPLSLFPGVVYTVITYLPFGYMLSFPITILLGKISPKVMINGFMIDIIWIILLYACNTYIWRKGIQQYEAIGN